jgi:hypothetical protein
VATRGRQAGRSRPGSGCGRRSWSRGRSRRSGLGLLNLLIGDGHRNNRRVVCVGGDHVVLRELLRLDFFALFVELEVLDLAEVEPLDSEVRTLLDAHDQGLAGGALE